MSFVSIGDLAQSFQSRRENARIVGEMNRLASELSSGLKTDVSQAVGGDFGPLAGIERSLKVLSAFSNNARDAGIEISARQTALDKVQTGITELTSALLLSQSTDQPALIDNTAAQARQILEETISALNTRIGGRSLFAGAATDGPALADADTILTDIMAVASSETTVAGVDAALDMWFGPAGGFETIGYLGSTATLDPLTVGDGVDVDVSTSALDPGLRGILKGMAMAALLDEGLFIGNPELRSDVALASGELLLSGETEFVSVRASVGNAESQVEKAKASLDTEKSAIEIARTGLLSADPFETASQLKAVETQLETFYALTARLSNLSLTDYLR